MGKRGRPALEDGEESTHVTVTVPASWYDRIYQEASRERETVPEVIRKRLAPEFSNTKSTTH